MRAIFCLAIVGVLLLAGCGRPSKANILLRKENQELRDQLAVLDRQLSGAQATIRALETEIPNVEVLPAERIEQLFTVHGLEFGRLTGPADLDPREPGEEGLKVYVVPVDGSGQVLKAAGSFEIEAFDLTLPDNQRIGRWDFPTEEAAKHWYGRALLYTYVLPLPWQRLPQSDEVTLRVTFRDALTQRVFAKQRVVKVDPATATLPVQLTER